MATMKGNMFAAFADDDDTEVGQQQKPVQQKKPVAPKQEQRP
jgi:hypothetical protein